MKSSIIIIALAAAADVLALPGADASPKQTSTTTKGATWFPTTTPSKPSVSTTYTTPKGVPSVSAAPLFQGSNKLDRPKLSPRGSGEPVTSVSEAAIYQGNLLEPDMPGVHPRDSVAFVEKRLVSSVLTTVKSTVNTATSTVASVVGTVTSALPIPTANIRGNCTKSWDCSVLFNGSMSAILTDAKNYTGNTQIAGGCTKGVCWGSVAAAGAGYAPIKLTCNNGGMCTGSGNGSVNAIFNNSSGIIQYGWYTLGGSCINGTCAGHLVAFGDPSY